MIIYPDLLMKPGQEILSSYSILRERLIINGGKKSLNSNKTSTIWKIYLKYLNV